MIQTLSLATDPVVEPSLPCAPDQWVRLPDGRRIAYRCHGPADKPAVFYFHGWPGSRIEPGFFDLDAVRLIALDRPGYGASDPLSQRQLKDWPGDVAAVADALGLSRFGIVGLSGGGPYAAACAHALADRVQVCVLISALGPPDARGMATMRLRLLRGLGRRPRTSGALFGLMRRVLISPHNDRHITRLRNLIPRGSRDLEALDPVFFGHLLSSWREALRRSTEGMASDARIYGQPWPFRLADLKVPLRIWHGEDDQVVPSSIATHYHAHCPQSILRLYPEEGHVSLVRTYLGAILEDLTPFLDD